MKYEPKMHKATAILARDLKPGDQFRLTWHPFSHVYTLQCIFADHIDGVDARTDCIHHCSVNKTDLVYKIEEVNDEN